MIEFIRAFFWRRFCAPNPAIWRPTKEMPSMPANVERSGYDTSDAAQDKYFARETVKERSNRINEAGRRAMHDSANRRKEGGGSLRPGSVICEHEVPEKLVADQGQLDAGTPLFVEFINVTGPIAIDESFVDGKRRITIRF